MSFDVSKMPNMQAPSIPTAEFHQPIGFVCCQCEWRSSGSYCSNPHVPNCPHRTAPRCQNCLIIFTDPKRGADGEKEIKGRQNSSGSDSSDQHSSGSVNQTP
ncbi:uncharacterized protein F4812DRAFT_408481 [Daldinia caldariorum]|uniref:uncharacterized protein n=1 Tax=Daldinia caldariorum TaxID=326644 RepID=UPI0020081B86|nr:uncharacterized protein F4812DRAFT_408481 [Daldinia caldariorum]KAI1472333.1 hypothetical protein F4812DRAFT_408481 [Daldinia caldariorum]